MGRKSWAIVDDDAGMTVTVNVDWSRFPRAVVGGRKVPRRDSAKAAAIGSAIERAIAELKGHNDDHAA